MHLRTVAMQLGGHDSIWQQHVTIFHSTKETCPSCLVVHRLSLLIVWQPEWDGGNDMTGHGLKIEVQICDLGS